MEKDCHKSTTDWTEMSKHSQNQWVGGVDHVGDCGFPPWAPNTHLMLTEDFTPLKTLPIRPFPPQSLLSSSKQPSTKGF